MSVREYRRALKEGRTPSGADIKAYENYKNAQKARQTIDGVKVVSPGVLDRTVAGIRSGKINAPVSQLNPEQRQQLQIAELRDQVISGAISAQQYQEKINQITQNYADETQERSFMFAQRAAPGLRAAAKAEAQRFADLATVDYSAQQAAQTKSLEKVASDIANAGFDPVKLRQAQGKPNPNTIIKINTPSEKRQNEFARSQAFRSVQSVTPNYGMDIVDSKGKTIAKNVKQSGGFGFAEKGSSPILTQAIIGASGNVLGTLTGKSPGSVFTVFETKKTKEVQGPMREARLPEFVKTAFYTFPETVGPKDPRFTGLVGKDFFAKDGFVSNVDYLGVPPKRSDIGEQLNKLSERAEALAFDKTRDPLSGFFLVGPGKLGVSITTSIFNLAGMAQQGLEKLISGKDIKVEQVNIPKTYEGEYLGTQAEGIFKAITTGDKSEIVKANIEAERKSRELFEKQGPFVSTGEILTGTIGIPFTKLSPIKGAFAKIPTESGPKVIGGSLKIGYGRLSTPIVTRLEGKFALGSGKKLLGKETFRELSPAAVDVTTGRALKAFELATVKGDVQNILTSREGLQSLVGAGKIRPDDVAFLKAEKRLAEIAALGQKKLGQKDLLQVDELPRGIFEGLETVKEEDVIVKIIPKLKPVKGSQIFFTQLAKKYQPAGLTQSDIDIDYLGGLLGERYATNQALKMTRQTVQELNDVMSSQRGAVARGSKVFTGIIEGVVFPRPKQIKLKGEGKKLMELLTRKDAEEGINSILSDQNKIFGISKTRKIVRTPTGQRGLFGLKKTRKEVPLPTQLLNQISSATRIQKKGIEDVFKGGGPIPFLKPGYKDFLRTESGFRVGTDVQRVKDLVRQQPGFLQLGELLEGKGYKGTITEVKSLFETIKKSKPEIDFDAAFKEVEKIGESENIESIASYYARQSKSGARQITPLVKLGRFESDEREKSKQKSSIQTNLNIKLDNLIDSSIRGSSRVSSSPSILESLSSIGSTIKTSIGSKPSKASKGSPSSKGSPISFSGIYGRSMPSISSPLKVSVPSITSPGSPTSPPSPGSPTFRSPPFKSPPKSPTFRLPIIRQPPSQPVIKFPKLAFLLPKFEQLRTQRLPSYAKRRFFVASPADFLRPGVFAPKGVKELRSSSPKIFKQIDINLRKARRNKKAFDPLTGFKISKDGSYVYSQKNLLGKFSKIKI